ncbi:MAG: precorrin-6y C5,15-methyltransferase (decarboxylating) subunit CbiE [Desulfobulbaceae bacterium]|nr:precorrin-6y C5,15-methyltransferase (decarboxylating) subunit CbiE [Desulfobulbaceae bacterium]HIJ79337.1 precorrin-6y C5,15-methyltransferase (decarboxylating) subunit CbiE [Deltaproteobacteria bacterium]
MFKIFLIGVGCDGLTGAQEKVVAGCGIIVGGNRHLELVAEQPAAKVVIIPLAKALAAIRQGLLEYDVAVLASGDPLFYGIGRRLRQEFGVDQLEVLPALSSMQEAAARFKMPWDDAALLSLHGRKVDHVAGLLLRQPKSLIFTDGSNSPDRLAAKLIDYLELIGAEDLLNDCRVQVAENLGTDQERLVSGSLREIKESSFADLNVFCLECPALINEQAREYGLTEDEIAHSRGLITKDEVRGVTLHKLRMPLAGGVLWDIGAGSGSVSVEAARLNPRLTVYAVERNEAELANIKRNICKFGCYNVIPVAGPAPAALSDLPDPDRVFVGGSGGNLAEIIAASARRLSPGGRLVINGVIEKTVSQAPQLMAECGLAVEISKIQVERYTFLQGQEPAKVFNPITVMVGRK